VISEVQPEAAPVPDAAEADESRFKDAKAS